jgi:hypothetical protein
MSFPVVVSTFEVKGEAKIEEQLCNSMDLTTAQAYARCCGSSGGYVCFQSGKNCPPVTVN